MEQLLTFGEAIEAAKTGKLIAREGWNGKGMFVFMRPADTIPLITVSVIKSLPDAVKLYFQNLPIEIRPLTIDFTAYLCMKAADNSIVNGWLASQTDMLAKDWTIVNLPS